MNKATVHAFPEDIPNVKSVYISPHLYERVKTGLSWIDNAITDDGGFVPSYVYLVSGQSGAGKSTMLRQISDGMTEQGHVVVYNSAEECKEQVAIAAKKLGLQHGFLLSTIRETDELIRRLSMVQSLNPNKRIVLIQDSIQEMQGSTLEVLATISDWAKTSLSVALCVSQVTKSGKFAGVNSILHKVDSHIQLSYKEGDTSRFFTLTKNRMGRLTEPPLEYIIDERGVVPTYPDDITHTTEVSRKEPSRFQVGARVRIKGPKKHRNKKGVVTKVGRTRVTLATERGEELYLPFDSIKVLP